MQSLNTIPIENFMTRDIISIRVDETLAVAYLKMSNHHIRHLPVVDGENGLVGIFTDVDLGHAYRPRETESGWYYDKDELGLLGVRHFMSLDPVSLSPRHTLKDAAEIMGRNRFGGIPIVDGTQKKLVGFISYVDVLNEIVKRL